MPAGHDRDVLRIALLVGGDDVATVTLDDTPEARDLVAALPITIGMQDRFGQAKVGRLPDPLPDDDTGRVIEPAAGHLYYWPPDGTIVVVTTDLGRSIPEPGLVPLGAVDSGLAALVAGADRFEMTIELIG